MDKYESEKPKSTKLLEQGFGYVIIAEFEPDDMRLVKSSEILDTETHITECYRRVRVVNIRGRPVGVFHDDSGRNLVLAENLRLRPPAGMSKC